MAKVRGHKRQKPKQPTQAQREHKRDLQKVVELELPLRRRAAMMQGVADRDEKLKALKYHQLEADIARLKSNLASVPVPYDANMKNAIAQMQQDLKELARQY